jgi:hypothetical protein
VTYSPQTRTTEEVFEQFSADKLFLIGAGCDPDFGLDSPPMVGNLLIVQVPHASNQGAMSVRFRPIDPFLLSSKNPEHVVSMVLDYIIIDR